MNLFNRKINSYKAKYLSYGDYITESNLFINKKKIKKASINFLFRKIKLVELNGPKVILEIKDSLVRKSQFDSFGTRKKILHLFNFTWLYSTNHRRIAIKYFLFIMLSGSLGTFLASIIRSEMAYPGAGVLQGDSIHYLSVVTGHGVIMVFFMIIPLLFGGFANLLLPLQLGVRDVASPRLNSSSFWFLPGGLIMLGHIVCTEKKYNKLGFYNLIEAETLLKEKFFFDMLTTLEKKKLQLNNNISYIDNFIYNVGISKSVSLYASFFNKLESISQWVKTSLYVKLKEVENKFQLSLTSVSFYSSKLQTLDFFKNSINKSSLFLNKTLFKRFPDYLNTTTLTFKLNNGFNYKNFYFNLNFYYLSSLNLYVLKTIERLKLIVSFQKIDKNSYYSDYRLNFRVLNSYINSGNFKRFFKNNYISIKYDYKNGNYLTNNSLEFNNTLLYSKYNANNLKKFNSLFLDNLFTNNFLSNLVTDQASFFHKKNLIPSSNNIIFNLLDINSNKINFAPINFLNLNKKFNKIFLSSNLQQKTYLNWKQIKFSREAWRSKLLVSRSQKSFYFRYINENNAFWVLERNAKDILPGWAMVTPFSSRIKYTSIGKIDLGLMAVLDRKSVV